MSVSVSVVVPVYNGESFLADAVRSVQVQTFTDWELVLVDDGSTDGSAPLAKQLARDDARIRVLRQPNAGVSAARNAGLAAAVTDQVSFLDVDDVWEPDALATLTAALDAAPWATAAHGLGRHIDRRGHPVMPGHLEAYTRTRYAVENERLVAVPPHMPTRFEAQVLQNHICTVGTVLFRRDAVERAGCFDTAIAFLEDWDLLLRVALLGPMAFVDHVVLGKRAHEHNVSNDFKALMRGLAQVRRKLVDLLADDPERLRVAVLGHRYSHRLNQRRELDWAWDSLRHRHLGRAFTHMGRAAAFSARELAVRWTISRIATKQALPIL